MKKRKSKAEQLLDLRVRAERDLFTHCTEVMGYPDLHEPLHRPLCEFLTRWIPGKDIKVCLIPRRHLKSTIGSISFPLWVWMNNPNHRILLSHGKRSMSTSYLRELKGHLRHNEKLKEVAPDIFFEDPDHDAEVWVEDKITVKRTHYDKTPNFVSAGTDSSVVGFHFHWLIFDDLVYKENVLTPDQRRKTLEYIQESLALGLPNVKVLIFGTRWHWDDMYSILIDPNGPFRDRVDSLVMDCGYNRGEPIFPLSASGNAGFTMDMLEKLRETMKDKFWAQYMNDPQSGEDKLFHRENIKYFNLEDNDQIPAKPPFRFYTAVDPNRTEKTQNDPCAVVTAALDSKGDIWVVQISRGHPSGPELVDWIREHVKRWSPESVLVEAVGYQYQIKSWLQQDMLKNEVYYRIRQVNRPTTTRKYDRIAAMETLVASGGLHVIPGQNTEHLINELEYFPTWRNDDVADALADIYAFGVKPVTSQEEVRQAPKNPLLMKSLLDEVFSREHTVARRSSRPY